MASTKLSAEDKQAIIKLYQEVGQTAATVAEQYGVSVSTISRILKSELPIETYEALVRQKRGGGESKSKKRSSRKKPVSKLKKEVAKPKATEAVVDESTVDEPAVSEVIEASEIVQEEKEKAPPRSRRRTRSSSEKKRPVSRRKTKAPEEAIAAEAEGIEEAIAEEVAPEVVEVTPEVVEVVAVDVEEASAGRQKPIRRTRPRLKRVMAAEEAEEQANIEAVGSPEVAEEEALESNPRRRTRRRTRTRAAVAEELPEVVEVAVEEEIEPAVEIEDEAEAGLALDDLTDSLESEDEDFDDAFDDDDDLDDEDEGSDNITSLRRRGSGADVVQIQPLSEANLSRMLYLVIDRTADLITMPMVFFSDLGALPAEEEEKKTLPVFENHRVARRFSQRNQRVIKVPDGELISKTASWLEAKGITRCLLDGQVYSLESADC